MNNQSLDLSIERQAKVFGISTSHALGAVLLGRELRISPVLAIQKVRFIEGQPTLSPFTMLTIVNSSGLLEDMTIADDGFTCKVMLKRQGRTPHSEEFSMEDAVRLGLVDLDDWKRQPKRMRQMRAIALCCRVVFAEYVHSFLTPEEMGVDINANGEMVRVGLLSRLFKIARLISRSIRKMLPAISKQTALIQQPKSK
jgi:hypothetical protein